MSTERNEAEMFSGCVSYAVEREQRELEITYKFQGLKNKFEKRTQHRKIPAKKDKEIININRMLIQLLIRAVNSKVNELRLYIMVPQSLYEEIYSILELVTDLEGAIFEYLTNDETN